MTLSNKGKDHIKECEGLKLTAYKCTADVWTIGYGHTQKRSKRYGNYQRCS